jgi:hypothetical protein
MTDGTNGTGFVISAITGFWSGSDIPGFDITGLLPAGGFAANNNVLFFPDTPYLDLQGVSFALSDAELVSIFFLGGTYGTLRLDPNCGDCRNGILQTSGVFTLVPTAVPLPAALPLFASGLAGLGWLARRRKRGQANHA